MIGSLGNAAKPQLAEPLAMNSSNPAAMVALIPDHLAVELGWLRKNVAHGSRRVGTFCGIQPGPKQIVESSQARGSVPICTTGPPWESSQPGGT